MFARLLHDVAGFQEPVNVAKLMTSMLRSLRRWTQPSTSPCLERSTAWRPAEDGLHLDMGLHDLMRRREDSQEPGLRRFSDKIQFKTWMMKEKILGSCGSSSKREAEDTHREDPSYVNIIASSVA